MGLFDSTLKQMSVTGTTWNGTWTTVSPDGVGGTNFSNSIMHFVTYQGTLLMTTENRDKPQRMTTSDTSFKNIDYLGSGTAPFAKYPQVWKEHVFLLNVGAGGQLTENAGDISGWTNQDVNTGSSSQTSFGGLSTFRFRGGTSASDNAHIKKVVAGMTTAYSAEIKTYFNTLGSVTSGDYAWMDIYNGSIRFRTRWSTDGVETFNGTTWLKIGVNLVSTGTWIVWKYLITAATATASVVDVFRNGSAVGLQFSVSNATTASSGQIDLEANAGGSANRSDWYMDYLYINSIVVRQNYYTDGVFNSWVSSSQASYTDNVLPSQAFLQYKCNDNAGNSTVTDSGTGAANGSMLSGATTINTSAVSVAGLISQAISLTTASSHNIQFNSASVSSLTADLVGSLSLWVKPSILSGTWFSVSRATGLTNLLRCTFSGNNLDIGLQKDGVLQWEVVTNNSLNINSWTHIVLNHDGVTPSVYINGSLDNVAFVNSNSKISWFSSLGTLDTAHISGFQIGGTTVSTFFNSLVDDVRYYRSSITGNLVKSLYAEGNGNEGNPVTVREGTTIYTGTFSYRINNDGQYALVNQTLSNGTALAGVPSLLGLFVNATNNSTYKLRVNDGTTNYDSAVLTANGTWQYQTLPFTPISNATGVMAQVISLSSSTVYIDMVSIVNSSTGITQDFSDRLQRSVSGTYDTWTGSDSGSNDITTPGDVGLTGSFILQDRMYITKAWNIYRITYTGSVPLLDIKQARSVVGTKSPRAIKNIDLPGIGEVVIFFGSDRNLYIFDGFSSSNLSDVVQLNNNIAQVYMNGVNSQALDKIFAVNHSGLGWYEIFLPMGNSTVPNFSLVYDYKTKAFWPNNNRNYLSGDVSDDGAGERVIMLQGASNGYIYEFNSDKTYYTDDGTNVNAYWTSFKLGEDYVLNKIDEFRLGTDSVNCTPTFGWRCNYETAYITKVLKANTSKHDFAPERIDNLIQFKISDSSSNAPFKIWHVKALERAIGIGT